MISHRHRCIYVKVPKCASTTLLHWFLEHGKADRSMRPWWYGGLESERFPRVAEALNLYPDYLAFAFVRNPYERFVSIYRSAPFNTDAGVADLRGGLAGRAGIGAFAELCAEVLDDFGPRWGREARDFFRANGEREYGPGRVRLRRLAWLIDHARPQADFLPDCNPGRLFGVPRVGADPLGFIGRVERMEKDFDRLREALGLPGMALARHNVSASGAGPERPWAHWYDEAARRRVEALYAADLDFTGDGFDDGRRVFPMPAPGPCALPGGGAPRRPVRTRIAGLRFRLGALEVGFEAWLRRFPIARRILRPIKRLRLGRPLRGGEPLPGGARARGAAVARPRGARPQRGARA